MIIAGLIIKKKKKIICGDGLLVYKHKHSLQATIDKDRKKKNLNISY